jgi:hypothetical protein
MRKALAALALTASIATSIAGRPTPLDPLWAFFVSLWNGQLSDAGCGWDPSGRCQPAQPTPDEGCGWDPNGRCNPGS